MKLKPEKISGLNGIQAHDLFDTGAVLYQLSYQANLMLLYLILIHTETIRLFALGFYVWFYSWHFAAKNSILVDKFYTYLLFNKTWDRARLYKVWSLHYKGVCIILQKPSLRRGLTVLIKQD